MSRSVVLVLALCACGPVAAAPDGGSCPADQPASCVQPSPTYEADIGQVIERRCLPCHAEGNTISGVSLATYGEIRSLGGVRVLSQTANCLMPPPDAGQLTPVERAELLHWLVCGIPEK